jgi:hypothetical protein
VSVFYNCIASQSRTHVGLNSRADVAGNKVSLNPLLRRRGEKLGMGLGLEDYFRRAIFRATERISERSAALSRDAEWRRRRRNASSFLPRFPAS